MNFKMYKFLPYVQGVSLQNSRGEASPLLKFGVPGSS